MTRQLIQSLAPLARTTCIPARRTLVTSTMRYAEGDTGGMRSGGAAQGDAFSKREQASEDYAVRQREMEKLQALRAKIAEHQKHLDELNKHVEDHMKDSEKK